MASSSSSETTARSDAALSTSLKLTVPRVVLGLLIGVFVILAVGKHSPAVARNVLRSGSPGTSPGRLQSHDDAASLKEQRCLTILIGLFTMDTVKETGRQEGWRKLLGNQLLASPMAPDADAQLQCGLNWVFVMGSPEGEPAKAPPVANAVRLPMPENMNEGKSMAWWKYAVDHFPSAHLFAKQDSDTQICPHRLLGYLDSVTCDGKCTESLYIGNLVDFPACGSLAVCPKGWVFASGGFHFLSYNLAAIFSPLLPTLPPYDRNGFEDLMTGRYVHSSRQVVKFVNTKWVRKEVYEFDQKDEASEVFLPGC